IAHVMACEVEAMADDRRRGDRCFARDFLQAADPRGHRFQKLAVEIATAGDKLAEIGRFEGTDPRRLQRAQAGDSGRAEQQWHLAEIVARCVRDEEAIDTVNDLAYLDSSLEEHEERRDLAFVDQPVAGAQTDVGSARGQRLELGCGQRREERDAAKKVDGDHFGRERGMSARRVAQGRVSARGAKACAATFFPPDSPREASLREPLNKSHVSRVSGAMAPDARRRGAANTAYY